MIDDTTQKDVSTRLRKIEGQIRGLEKMVTERRYCVEILNQVAAVKRALDSVGMTLLKRHVETCVAHAIKSNKAQGSIDELVETVNRLVR